MARDDKLLARMRANPRGDWRIEDVARVAARAVLILAVPSGGGSHYTVQSLAARRQIVRPYRRPILPVHVGQLIALLDDHVRAGAGGPDA